MTFHSPIGAAAGLRASSPAALAGDESPAGASGGAIPLALFCGDEAMVAAWRRLESAGTLPTQGHAFAAALAGTLLAVSSVEVFFTSSEAGVEALMALCREKGPFARWHMAGAYEVYEPGDALCSSPGAAARLAGEIARQPRAVELDRLPADSPLIPALQTAMRGRGLVSIRPARPGPTIRLDEGWQDPESRFNSGRRSDFRRASRKAAALGAVSYEIVSPTAHEFDALFDEAVAVELRSWKAAAATAISSDRAKELFFRSFFRRACEQGTFRLALLRIGGEIAAMQMGLETLGRFWLFKIGFDERFGHCSPGNLLMLHSIGWAARRGLESYELLGSTENWITTFWTREQHAYVKLRTYPFGPRGAVALIADAFAWLRHGLARRRG